MKKYNDELISILRTGTRDIKEYIFYLVLLEHEVWKVSDKPLPEFLGVYLTEIHNELVGMNVIEPSGRLSIEFYESKGNGNTLDWVKAIVDAFKEATRGLPNKVHSLPSTKKRIETLMREHNLNKDEIMQATLLYLQRTEPKFVMFSHYFVLKGVGTAKTSLLLDYVEEVRNLKIDTDIKRTSITGVLQ